MSFPRSSITVTYSLSSRHLGEAGESLSEPLTPDNAQEVVTPTLQVEEDTAEEEKQSVVGLSDNYFAESFRSRYPNTNGADDDHHKEAAPARHSYEYWASKHNSSDSFSDVHWAKLAASYSTNEDQPWGI